MKQVILLDMADLESLRLGTALTIPVPLGVTEVTIGRPESPVPKGGRAKLAHKWSHTGDHKPRKPTPWKWTKGRRRGFAKMIAKTHIDVKCPRTGERYTRAGGWGNHRRVCAACRALRAKQKGE